MLERIYLEAVFSFFGAFVKEETPVGIWQVWTMLIIFIFGQQLTSETLAPLSYFKFANSARFLTFPTRWLLFHEEIPAINIISDF